MPLSSSNHLWSSVVHQWTISSKGNKHVFTAACGWIHGYKDPVVINIDKFNIFWGNRHLFKLDCLHPNKLGARVLKDNIYFSLRHPSMVCANGQSMSDHRTSYQLQSHHVVDTSHKDTDNTMQPKENTAYGHPCWALPTELITNRLWRTTTTSRLSTQGRLSGKQPGKPGQHFTATGNTRARAKLIRHTISLSNIFTSKLITENGGTGVCWDQTLPLLCCKPPDINKKTAGLLTTKDCPAHPPPPVRALRPLPQRQGPNSPPSAVGEPKTSDNSSQWYVSGPRYIAATFTNVYRTSENPLGL